MLRRVMSLGIATIALAVVIGAVATRPAVGTAKDADPPAMSETEVRDADIAFWEKRVSEDPQGAIDRAHLAALYLRRARETGNYADYERAERTSRESLQMREAHNAATFSILASALLARHEFTGAFEAARQVARLEPETPQYEALLAEIQLELGRYDEANAHFSSLKRAGDQPTVAARLARWYEITGHIDAAERVLAGSRARVARIADVPSEQLAWFDYRLGEVALKRGRLPAADSLFRRGLSVFPEDYRILGAMARLELARRSWQGAIEFGARAIAIQLDPAALGAMSDAYAALGDSVQAKEYAQAMRTSALGQPGPIHRAWGLFLLDHNEDVATVLTKAEAELRTRHDVYGYDLVAWALHKSGRDAEARTRAMQALSQGTEDAMLFYHAGMIEHSLGDADAARAHLGRALELNPTFHHTQATIARETLRALSPAVVTH